MKVGDDKARNLMFSQQPRGDRIEHGPKPVRSFLCCGHGGADEQPHGCDP